ncbi:flagellar assembly protein A [Rugamonas sp. DEMB1]|uniref:flagellar assembly protein A n=1 Tax=Rugamonas sp. DEMB1 TaxID=3039386 RepID=UPI00244A0C3F|nr:flagellar assembly protein A [Rugamonas sp. DEMB1]WGG52202.1 FapA family protein [Rugamonas sp. DEMB1]
MSNDAQAVQQVVEEELACAVLEREDGVYFAAGAPTGACLAGVDAVFQAGAMFVGIDYPVFLKALYNCAAALPGAPPAEVAAAAGAPAAAPVRFADRIAPLVGLRRALYKAVKIVNGEAEYYFEPVYLEGAPELQTQPAKLDFDEFVADMWGKGIRFGIDAAAVKDVIAAGRLARIVVARRLNAMAGQDASIVEVSAEIHRSNAPRELADGRVDLHSFQNRFPQVKPNVKLLRKVPRAPGRRGFELSGILIEPPLPRDVELDTVAGAGTVIENLADGEYLVSGVEGFLNIDPASKRLSIGPKIISRDGVSARTTGNLDLKGEYEEFGEVQDGRLVEGGDISIHGDVFGKLQSRGGTIVLYRNLVGGSAVNAAGDIRVKGVASGAVLQTRLGEVVMARAESCVISATRVVIGEANNCEIIADEVLIKVAEGCAIAARKIEIGRAGPRKQSEMLLFPLVPDTGKYEQRLAELGAQAAQCERAAQRDQAEIDQLTSQAEVRSYLTLATRLRRRELVLTADQEPLFHKMAAAVGPVLKAVAKLSLSAKAAQAQRGQLFEQLELVRRKRAAVQGGSRCRVQMFAGETLVRSMVFNPDTGTAYDGAPKDIRARLRAANKGLTLIFSGASGALDWSLDAAATS